MRMLSAGGIPDGQHAEPSPLAITERELDRRTTVLEIAGELDLAAAPELKWILVDLLDGGHDQIALDLSNVSFMDSTALGVMVGIERSLDERQRFAIANPQPAVLKVFNLTRLDRVLRIFATLDEALVYVREGDAGRAV